MNAISDIHWQILEPVAVSSLLDVNGTYLAPVDVEVPVGVGAHTRAAGVFRAGLPPKAGFCGSLGTCM